MNATQFVSFRFVSIVMLHASSSPSLHPIPPIPTHQNAARKSLYCNIAALLLANSWLITSIVVRMISLGFPGMNRSASASAQQAICTISSAAMHTRKEVSLDMTMQKYNNEGQQNQTLAKEGYLEREQRVRKSGVRESKWLV